MSFSHSVKKELCSIITDKDRKYCCLYGMLLFCKNFTPDSITFQTENQLVCELFCRLADDVIGGRSIVEVTETKKKNDVTVMKDMIKWKFKLKVQSSFVSKVTFSFSRSFSIC